MEKSMRYLENEPMTISQVHTTMDYSKFKSIDGNRKINRLHLARLKNSIAENYLFTIITVNENYEIIDGQHRFECIKELQKTLHYVVCKGYGINEVQRLNINSKNWHTTDYVDGYIDLGLRDYSVFKQFQTKYGIGILESIILLSGKHSIPSDSNTNIYQNFKNGKFKINDLFGAEDKMDKINLIAPYYVNYKRRSFILAMMGMFKIPEFEFTEFLQKLKIQPTALQDCTSIPQYKMLIEEIYNYKRREKVNLRF
jgi:hypothetical protein